MFPYLQVHSSWGQSAMPRRDPSIQSNSTRSVSIAQKVSQGALFWWLEAQGLDAALPETPDLPATNIIWHDAAAYCGWVGRRLPTEAEWERAARGPSGFAYPWGQDRPSPRSARFAADGPVGVYGLPADTSPEGALHLSGNVAEWVADWYDPQYYARSQSSNPLGPATRLFQSCAGRWVLLNCRRLASDCTGLP